VPDNLPRNQPAQAGSSFHFTLSSKTGNGTQNALSQRMGRLAVQGLNDCCRIAICIIVGAGCIAAAGQDQKPPKDPGLPEGYRIGAGDVLSIVVWKEPEASVPEVMVRADGKISLPLIGEVVAAGLTPDALKESVAGKLTEYIKSPSVTVLPRVINSRKVYVAGNVKKEGPLPLLRPLTVLQAINEAGGLADFASKKKIYVLRTVNGKQEKLPFDYGSVIKGKHLEQNVFLLPDDTIVVP
jgi:polysaccharide biosynthesis/export protein